MAVPQPPEATAALLPPATTVLFGGSFDPPHLGHQMACHYHLEGLGAADLWLIPAANHPFGKVLTAFAQRLQLCEALVAPFGGRATVQPIEAELGGAGRTFDTVCALQARHPERHFALALGADLAAELPRWHRAEALQQRLPLIWIGRGGSRALPEQPELLQLPQVSSSALRARRRAGGSLVGWVPQQVAARIEALGLYC